MAFTITIVCSEVPQISEFTAAVDAAAWANARWWLDRSRDGLDPPCCLDCAGVCYLPDRPTSDGMTLLTGDELLRRGGASCGEVVAYYLGVARAKSSGRTTARVQVTRTAADTLHATLLQDGKTLDPCRDLQRC